MGDTAEGSWGSRELGGYIRREEARQEREMLTQGRDPELCECGRKRKDCTGGFAKNRNTIHADKD